VTQGYDDWYSENAPCSSESSRRLSCPLSRGWIAEFRLVNLLWMPALTAMLLAALVIAFASGCGRTVFVSESTPMRVGPMMKSRVYHRVDGEWVLSQNAVPIPEGWYMVPPSYVDGN